MYKRKCPDCGGEVTYLHEKSLKRAENENRSCRKCMNRGIIPWNKGSNLSEEHKKNISNSEKGREITWGDKISKSRKGRKLSSEHIEKLKQNHVGMKGKSHSIETLKKMSEIKMGINNPMFGKEKSDETRKKHRISMINYINGTIKENGKTMHPNFNKIACDKFDEISKLNNIKIKHAMNGGEFYIQELGYWLDGYDIENNVVYEFDESHHYDFDGNLRDKDILRENQIKDFLKCKIIRIKEDKI